MNTTDVSDPTTVSKRLIDVLLEPERESPRPEPGAAWCAYCRRNYTDRPRRLRCSCGRKVVRVPPKVAAKKLIEMSNEELAASCKYATVKAAHEERPVVLETDIADHGQHGFGFMREEFK